MNANTIFLIIQLLIFCLFISCLIVGDTYLTYMVFNARTYMCEGFNNVPTIVPTTAASTTTASTTAASTTAASTTTASTTTASTTAAATTAATTTLPSLSTSQYSTCYSLSAAQLGFVRFKIVMFWILFVCITGFAIYRISKLYSQNQILFSIIIAITIIMAIFIIVGGVFMTQYGFTGSNKTCQMPNANISEPQIKKTEYCYNLNSVELDFAKMAVVFGWMYSFAAIITIGLFLWEKNFG